MMSGVAWRAVKRQNSRFAKSWRVQPRRVGNAHHRLQIKAVGNAHPTSVPSATLIEKCCLIANPAAGNPTHYLVEQAFAQSGARLAVHDV